MRVRLDGSHTVTLDPSLADGDVAAATDTVGHWIVAAPGVTYQVVGGIIDPLDGVDRNCDGED